VFAVAVFAMTAAVVGPAYARATEQSVLSTALHESSASGVGFRASRPLFGGGLSRPSEVPRDRLLDEPVGGLEAPSAFYAPNGQQYGTLAVYRDDVCTHLRIVAGSCNLSGNSIVISRRTAAATGLKVGSQLNLGGLHNAGKLPAVVVAGLYEPKSEKDSYWLAQPYFLFQQIQLDPQTSIQGVEAVFADQQFMAGLPAEVKVVADVSMRVDEVRLDDIDRLSAAYATADQQLKSAGWAVTDPLAYVLQPVAADRALVSLSIPLVAAELVLIAWFVLVLVVSDATDVRGPEVALARLRGHRGRAVAAFGLGESLLLVLAATPVGLALGLLVTELIGWLLLAPGTHVEFRLPVLGVAALALGGALVAVATAGRRVLRLSVAELLRRVPPRQHALRAGIVDGVVIALAVAALVQLFTDRGRSASPLALVAPGMVAVVTGIVVARLLPLFARTRRTAARRAGRLPGMVGWAPLERRSSGRRSVLVVTVAVALLFFSAIAWDTAASDRQARAAGEVGADRVLTVRAPTERKLLEAVRAADPSGRYAMAAVQYAAADPDGVAAVLGVDSSRLAAVAKWDRGNLTEPLAAAAAALSKPAPSPVLTIHGPALELSMAGQQLKSHGPLNVSLELRDSAGGSLSALMGTLTAGSHVLHGTVTGCAAGCRLESIHIQRDPLDYGTISGVATVTGLVDGGKPVPRFAGAGLWRTPDADPNTTPLATLTGDANQLQIGFASDGGEQVYAVRSDTPAQLPVILAGKASLADAPDDRTTTAPDGTKMLLAPPSTPPSGDASATPTVRTGAKILGPDLSTQPHTYVVAAQADYIPGAGSSALMVDLAYVDRISNTYGRISLTDEVWLAPDAPASVLSKLSAAGIVTLSDTTYAKRLTTLDQQGPTLALRLYLVAAIAALLLAAGAVVVSAYLDGRVRAYEFGVLRLTGVKDVALRGAARLEYVVPAVVGVIAGLVAGAVGAVVALPAVPVFSDNPLYPKLVYLPGPYWPVSAALLAFVVLVLVAVVVAARSVRGGTIRRVQEGQQ
jgi:hypothetical protein